MSKLTWQLFKNPLLWSSNAWPSSQTEVTIIQWATRQLLCSRTAQMKRRTSWCRQLLTRSWLTPPNLSNHSSRIFSVLKCPTWQLGESRRSLMKSWLHDQWHQIAYNLKYENADFRSRQGNMWRMVVLITSRTKQSTKSLMTWRWVVYPMGQSKWSCCCRLGSP